MANQNPLDQSQVTDTIKMMTAFFKDETIEEFIAAFAHMNAQYYLCLVKEGVPPEAAASMASQWKGPGTPGM